MKEKYETCIHAEKVGQTVVYARPSCPQAAMINGYLVSSKNAAGAVRCTRRLANDGA